MCVGQSLSSSQSALGRNGLHLDMFRRYWLIRSWLRSRTVVTGKKCPKLDLGFPQWPNQNHRISRRTDLLMFLALTSCWHDPILHAAHVFLKGLTLKLGSPSRDLRGCMAWILEIASSHWYQWTYNMLLDFLASTIHFWGEGG